MSDTGPSEGLFSSARNESKSYGKYLGLYQELYAGYSTSSDIRKNAASGGLVTGLLSLALEDGVVDGVFVSKTIFNKEIDYQCDIVTSAKELWTMEPVPILISR